MGLIPNCPGPQTWPVMDLKTCQSVPQTLRKERPTFT